MLTEERHSIILDMINNRKSITVSELCEILKTSESTIRRDLNTMAEKGLLNKVHGGAIALNDTLEAVKHDVEEKSKLYIEEKSAIARYAAALIEDGDFVYIDAGTTTEKMIDFLPDKNAAFVTNCFIHAKKLARRGFKVFIPGGEVKAVTEAIVGAECVLALQKYNFTKSFIGVNGISAKAGFTTPDGNEAGVKSAVAANSKQVYVLADHSKFDKISSVTFMQLNEGIIITDRLEDKKYIGKASIKEVYNGLHCDF